MLKQKQALKPVKSSSQSKNLKHFLAGSLLKAKLYLPILLTVTTGGIAFGTMMLPEQVPPAQAQSSMAQELLNAQNAYRAQVGVPPLKWSNSLASQAQQWANYLSTNGKFEHSHTSGQGENLWMGTSRRFSFTQMVGSWGNEKQYFVRGKFPNVSNTGNWAAVGHYTQMVWRNTTQVGCAGVDGRDGNYRLVCRYVSPGNVMGQAVF